MANGHIKLRPIRDDDPRAKFAGAILREVPLGQLNGLLEQLGSSPVAIGDACGNGCGSGCGNSCARAIDPFGYTELTVNDLESIVRDRDALKAAVAEQLTQVAESLRG